jgi:H+/Cl- antiporter ClcA
MYFIIFGLPVAAVFAALQIFLCKKSDKKTVRFVPLFITLGIIAALGLLLLDSVSGFLARYIDWGVFALVVYLVIGAIGSAMGTAAGWIIYCIVNKFAKNSA